MCTAIGIFQMGIDIPWSYNFVVCTNYPPPSSNTYTNIPRFLSRQLLPVHRRTTKTAPGRLLYCFLPSYVLYTSLRFLVNPGYEPELHHYVLYTVLFCSWQPILRYLSMMGGTSVPLGTLWLTHSNKNPLYWTVPQVCFICPFSTCGGTWKGARGGGWVEKPVTFLLL